MYRHRPFLMPQQMREEHIKQLADEHDMDPSEVAWRLDSDPSWGLHEIDIYELEDFYHDR